MMESAAQDEKDWEAFCYVCGEMTAEERHAFELCLASDESLCDAVERAVELNEGIRASSSAAVNARRVVQVASRSRVRRRQAAWGMALAASLAAVWLGRTAWEWRDSGHVAGPGEGATPSGVSGQAEAGVSLAWSDLRQREASAGAAGSWPEPDLVAETPSPDDGMGDPADALPPQWLLTAVAGATHAKETP